MHLFRFADDGRVVAHSAVGDDVGMVMHALVHTLDGSYEIGTMTLARGTPSAYRLAMSLGDRTIRSTNDLSDGRALLTEAARLAPDRVVLALWPPLKLAAAAADVLIVRAPSSRARSTDLALRAADWLLFAGFPRVAGRLPRATVVSALTAAQLAATVTVIQRRRRSLPAVAQLLAPQAAWLAYASLVPFWAQARVKRRAAAVAA